MVSLLNAGPQKNNNEQLGNKVQLPTLKQTVQAANWQLYLVGWLVVCCLYVCLYNYLSVSLSIRPSGLSVCLSGWLGALCHLYLGVFGGCSLCIWSSPSRVRCKNYFKFSSLKTIAMQVQQMHCNALHCNTRRQTTIHIDRYWIGCILWNF